jgi:hypothetical protein
MRRNVWASVAVLATVPAIASAQWSDNFDSYAPGSINGLTTGGPNALGTWAGWANTPANAGTVSTTQFLSAPNSQAIGGIADSVHRYQGVTSGIWNYSAMQYVPTGVTGTTYFILLNTYTVGGAEARWSLQARFNMTTGLVDDDTTAAAGSPGTIPRTLVRDQWVPISATFDLTANTLSWSYNNQLVWTGSWTRGTAGANNALGAVDLFNLDGTGNIFYDNVSLTAVPAPASLALLAVGGVVAGRRRRS